MPNLKAWDTGGEAPAHLQLRPMAPVAHAHANTSILASVIALWFSERVVAAPSAPKIVPAATTNGCLRSAASLARRSVAL